jgi:hypothetical protein
MERWCKKPVYLRSISRAMTENKRPSCSWIQRLVKYMIKVKVVNSGTGLFLVRRFVETVCSLQKPEEKHSSPENCCMQRKTRTLCEQPRCTWLRNTKSLCERLSCTWPAVADFITEHICVHCITVRRDSKTVEFIVSQLPLGRTTSGSVLQAVIARRGN